MYYFETDRYTYEYFSETFPDLRPENKIELVCMDINLERLGFVDVAPCVFKIDITKEELILLVEELEDMYDYIYNLCVEEFDKEKSGYYYECEKYAWMYTYLYEALKEERTEHAYDHYQW
ncbi:MAG: hypothetical protein IKT73_01105 [Anaerotignum sp.]|nr:hypothetical protein [Anaerotignum sp.]